MAAVFAVFPIAGLITFFIYPRSPGLQARMA
jgi:hypothetical protein